MKHRIQTDISFDNEQDAIDLLNYIENIKDKGYKPKGTEKILCNLQCRYHECTHEEVNPVQCKDYLNIDFDKPKVTHKIKGV